MLAFKYDLKVMLANYDVEGDINMAKVQKKVSGCFRTEKALNPFAKYTVYSLPLRKLVRNYRLLYAWL